MRIVLAYAGSLEGSAAIRWLHERHDAEVVTVTLDLGQGRELEAIRDRALALGALRAHVLDARDAFAHDYVVPALRADALHEGRVPMALALSRPLIARTLVEIAGIESADAVAHTGHAVSGTSPLDRLLASLAPTLRVLTPVREWELDRGTLERFARHHGFTAGGDAGPVEANFWGRSTRIAAGPDAAGRTPEPQAEPAAIVVTFSGGVPAALNGVPLPLVELTTSLGTLASRHGVGPVRAGSLSCEAAAALILHAAHRDLTSAVSGPDVQALSSVATAAYASLVEDARWFSPMREGLDAYFAAVQAPVSGHVHVRLSRGAFVITATELPPVPSGSLRPLVPSQIQH